MRPKAVIRCCLWFGLAVIFAAYAGPGVANDDAAPTSVANRILEFFNIDDNDGGDEDDDTIARAGEYIDGRAAVRIDEERAALAGIEISPLTETQFASYLEVRSVVLAPDELLDARRAYRQTAFRVGAAERRLNLAREALHQLSNLSGRAQPPLKRLREAQLERSIATAELASLHEDQRALVLQLQLRWGVSLTETFLQTKDETALRAWLNVHTITLISMPTATTLPDTSRTLEIDDPSNPDAMLTATFLATTTMRDTAAGETWIALIEHKRLTPGTRLRAKVYPNSDARNGVVLPPSAIVWHYGKPWVYVQHTAGVYLRTPVDQYERSNNGWFVPGDILVGQQVVSTGAQALLSEESRWNIPEEDDAD